MSTSLISLQDDFSVYVSPPTEFREDYYCCSLVQSTKVEKLKTSLVILSRCLDNPTVTISTGPDDAVLIRLMMSLADIFVPANIVITFSLSAARISPTYL